MHQQKTSIFKYRAKNNTSNNVTYVYIFKDPILYIYIYILKKNIYIYFKDPI